MNQETEIIRPGFTRVTSILEPYTDFSGIPADVLANAARRGSKVHEYCESYALNLLIEKPDEDCKSFVDSFKKWFDEYVEEVVGTEERLYDEDLMITGKYDLLVKLRDSPGILLIDIKTPIQAQRSWGLQSAAYAMMLEKKGVKTQRRAALMLDRAGGDPKLIEYTNHTRDGVLFLNLVELHRYFYGSLMAS